MTEKDKEMDNVIREAIKIYFGYHCSVKTAMEKAVELLDYKKKEEIK